MNLIVVHIVDVDTADASFKPDPRVIEHLKSVVRSESGDILKVGVFNGQKGCGQYVIDKNGEARINLLPLNFQTIADAVAYLTERWDSEVESLDPEKYIWPALSRREVQAWFVNPYLTVIPLLPATGETEPFAEWAPKLQRHTFSSHPVTTFPPVVSVAIALPRPKTFDKLLQYLASLSVGNLVFFAGARAELAYLSSPKLKRSAIKHSLQLGLEQSCKTVPPTVSVFASWKKAQAELINLTSVQKSQLTSEPISSLVLIAHPYRVQLSDSTFVEPTGLIESPLLNHQGPVLLILGPERGFLDEEIQTILKTMKNSHLIELGDDIMRCEVAACALVSQVKLLTSKSSLRPVPATPAQWKMTGGAVNLPIRGANEGISAPY